MITTEYMTFIDLLEIRDKLDQTKILRKLGK